MPDFTQLGTVIAIFMILAMASRQFGEFFAKARLPLITGFLFTGMIVGPSILELIDAESVKSLRFVDQVSLAVIAFAAGAELRLKEMMGRLRAIGWILLGQLVFIFSLTCTAMLIIADNIPFLADTPMSGRVAVAILASAILIARSPSSAIAIVAELRAKGPFTQTVLGLTMIMDVVVIVLFAVCASISVSLIDNLSMDLGFVAILALEISASILLGVVLGKLLGFFLGSRLGPIVKIALILLPGYGVFVGSEWFIELSHHHLHFHFTLEPLLICMVAGFTVTNLTKHHRVFHHLLERVEPLVFVAFFTLTGASLDLEVLKTTWSVALILVAVRASGIFLGGLLGGSFAKEPAFQNRVSWLAYITQAGVGLGLAKQVADRFPGWGEEFATTVIAVIIINQIVGPPLFKWVIQMVGEAHHKPKMEPEPYDGVRDAIIFGIRNNAYMLARQLSSHGWQVKLATRRSHLIQDIPDEYGLVNLLPDYSVESLMSIETHKAEAVITMFSNDEESLEVCEVIRENFHVKDLIVRLSNLANIERFRELKARVVEPTSAVINLLDHMVRAPVATSLIAGMDEGNDVVGLELRDPALDGTPLVDLRLPFDVVILSISREGAMVTPHGDTVLHLGDWITLVGPTESLETAGLLFDVTFPVGDPSRPLAVAPVVSGRATRRTQDSSIVWPEYVSSALMAARLDLADKPALFRKIAELYEAAEGGDPEVLYNALVEREEQGNTIIGDGLAIPHAMVPALESTSLGVVTLAQPLDYRDKSDVDVVIFMLGPPGDRQSYLKLLARTANMCRDADLLDRLRAARSSRQLWDVLLACERILDPKEDRVDPEQFLTTRDTE